MISVNIQIQPFSEVYTDAALDLLQEVAPTLIQADLLPGDPGCETLLALAGDHPVGLARTYRLASTPQGRLFVGIVVEPATRRRGIGTQLLDAVRGRVKGVFPEGQLLANFDDSAAATLAFAEAHGFEIQRHMLNMQMDLSTFDAAPFQPAIEQAQASGIRFVTYAELGDTPANQRRMYDLNYTLNRQIPIAEALRMPFTAFESYVAARLGRPETHKHEGIFIALDGDEWIGFSGISIHRDKGFAFNEMTGVLTAYTGRRLAQALKTLALQFAQTQAVPQVRTFNDAGNAPMLAVNEKLGYQRTDGFYTVWLRTL